MPRQTENYERPKWSIALLLIGGAIILLLGLMSLMLSISLNYNSYAGAIYQPFGGPYALTGILFSVFGFITITLALLMKQAHSKAVRTLGHLEIIMTIITLATIFLLGSLFTSFLVNSGSSLIFFSLMAIPFEFIGSAYGITHM
jgi:hypothetical protein